VKGYIALTDRAWYDRLRGASQAGEVNFWRPSSQSLNLPPGTPFLFKLKAPDRAIAGFGFFASFSVLPTWLAWETFREANGVTGVDDFTISLERI
jgi:putative restriction endonuclease